MRKTSFTIIVLFISLIVLAFARVNDGEDCSSCIENGGAWCALTNVCASNSASCQYKFNVTWFHLEGAKRTNIDKIDDHCMTGIFTSVDQCPSTYLNVIRGASISENYKYPLGRQPRVGYNYNLTRDFKDLVIGNYFIEGSDVKYSSHPYFFSFNYHVDRELPAKFIEDNPGVIQYMDLAVASEPLMYYKIGYGLILPRNRTDQTYQCVFTPDDTKIWQKADYQWIWKGPHLYLGFPLITIVFGLIFALVYFCASKFTVKNHYHEDDHSENTKRVFLPDYSYGGSYSIIEILRSLIFASDSDIVAQCGTDAYYYLWFHKYTMIYLSAMCLVSLPLLLPTYYYAEDFAISFKDFAGFTIASMNLRTSRRLFLTYGVLILFGLMGCVYLYFLRKLARVVVKSNNNFGSLYTVMVSNISTRLRNRKHLLADFAKRYGDCVVDAHICYDMRELTSLDRERENYQSLVDYYQSIYDRTGERPTVRTGFLWLQKSDALYHYGNLMNQTQAKIDRKQQSKKINGTGYGFVTFNSIAAAQNCINDHVFRFCGYSLPLWCLDSRWDYIVTAAPEADDVNYDSLAYSRASRWIRSLITNSIMTVILLVVYLVVFIASFLWFYNSTNVSKIWDFVSVFGPLAYLLQIMVDLTPEIISAITETVKPILEVLTDWEKHPTRTEYRQSVIRKTAFFMFIAIIILPYFSIYINGVWKVWYKAMDPFDNYIFYFNFMGVEMITICIVLSTIAKSIELVVSLVRMLYQLFRYKKMDRLEFEYDASYGFKITMLVLALIWGALTPLCLPFVLFFFAFTYWIDKFLIMFLYEKGHEVDGRALNSVADVTSYYLNAYPIYIIVILPTLLAVWKTWLILLPFLVILFFALRAIDRRAKDMEIEKIVVGIKEATEEEPVIYEASSSSVVTEASTTSRGVEESYFPEDDNYNGAITVPAAIFDYENDVEEDNLPPVTLRPPQSPSVITNVISSLKNKSFGPESRLSAQDIESLVSQDNIMKMANRYKHPYLRKQVSQRKQDVSEQF